METAFHYPAEYYDEDYTYGIPDRGDIVFYKKYAGLQGPPILELGLWYGTNFDSDSQNRRRMLRSG